MTRRIFLVLILLFVPLSLVLLDAGQNRRMGTDDPAGAAASDAGKSGFPGSWAGVYQGILEGKQPGGKTFTVAMTLEITPDPEGSGADFTLIYGEGEGRQVRAYRLETEDARQGRYLIDEKNSILLDATLTENTLTSFYSVGRAIMTVSYTREAKGILFELVSARFAEPRKSGGKQGVPEVASYPITARQSARLVKQVPETE